MCVNELKVDHNIIPNMPLPLMHVIYKFFYSHELLFNVYHVLYFVNMYGFTCQMSSVSADAHLMYTYNVNIFIIL